MANTFRAALSLIALNLSLIIPAFAQSHSSVSTPMRPLSAEAETLRDLTYQYGRALVAGDLDAMRRFWNPKSPNLALHFRSYKNVLAQGRIEFTRPEITRLEVTGDKAVSFFTADERRFDKKTGAVLSPFDPFNGACRSFEWIKTSAGWQIEKEFLVQDELAGRLGATRSDQERDEILEKEKSFVNNTLLNSLGTRVVRHQPYGEYDVAQHYVELQRAIAEKIGDKAGIAGSWLHEGVLKHGQEEHEISVAALLKALALFEASGNKRGMALTQENLSNVYRALGDHRRAFDFAQKSLRLSEETKHRRGMMIALRELGVIYRQQNSAEQASAHFEKALALAQDLEDTYLIATVHHDMARHYIAIGDHDRALPIYQQLLKQIEGVGDRGGAAALRDMIAQIYNKQKRYDEALSYDRQALAELDPAKHRRPAIVILNNMSLIHIAQENYAEASKVAGEAVSRSRETRRKDDLGVALTNLGYSQLGLKRFHEARESFAEAVSIMETLRTMTAGGAEEQQRYFERALRAHHGLIGVLVKENEPQAALLSAERAKARSLLDMLQQGRVRVNKAMTAGEQEEERRLKSELTQLNKQLARLAQVEKDAARVNEVETKLEKARLNYETFQNSLYVAHPELKTQRGEAPIINVQELGALLPDSSTALLEYVVTNDKTYLFTVTKPAAQAEAEIKVYTLPLKRDELTQQIESFRQQLANRDLGFRTDAGKLYDMLVKPAESEIRGKRSLVIAPDSSLWDLPFQALVTNSNRFMIENASISYAPSLTVLREMTKRRINQSTTRASTTLLALGNPVSEGDAVKRTSSSLRNHNLDPLPEASEEVKAVGRLYGASRSRVYIGSQAREDVVKNEASRASILHFTTHGTFNNASPMYSHLTLAEGGPNEDGLLEAWELMQLDLKAELAVLSACETARGRIGAGEGMIGFSWAMFIAGVPSLVVSQWKIESAGTRDFMVNFHRALISPSGPVKSKQAKTDALRQAALKLLRNPETSHPFYWAAFVLVGDGG